MDSCGTLSTAYPPIKSPESNNMFRSCTENRERDRIVSTGEPKDKYRTTLIIFHIIGIASLLPWRFYLTAYDYWMYKFKKVDMAYTDFQKSFTAYLNLATTLSALVVFIANFVVSQSIPSTSRMVIAHVIFILLFAITTVMVRVDTDEWQPTFFGLTIISEVLLNMAGTIMVGTMYEVISKFPPKYVTAVTGGQAVSGIFSALAQLLSLAVGATPVQSALVYFSFGDATVVVSFAGYLYLLFKSDFFRHTMLDESRPNQNSYDQMGEEQEDEAVNPRWPRILAKIWPYCVSSCCVFGITLSVFPGITVLIHSQANDGAWRKKYFVPTANYLLFAVGDYAGRLSAVYVNQPESGYKQLVWNVARIVFIPLFFLCNMSSSKHTLLDTFDKDYMFIIIMAVFSFSYGYFANLAALSVTRVVDQDEKEIAAGIYTIFIGTGLVMGSLIEIVLLQIP